MRTAGRIAADELRPARLTRTGAAFQEGFVRSTMAGGAGEPLADVRVSWVGSSVTVKRFLKFGLSGVYGFGQGLFV